MGLKAHAESSLSRNWLNLEFNWTVSIGECDYVSLETCLYWGTQFTSGTRDFPKRKWID